MRQPFTARVMLADRPGSARSALAALVAATSGLSLVAEVSDVEEIDAAVRNVCPDVVVIDDRLLRGETWNARDIDPRVIVVGVDDDPAYGALARRIGADAWVPKDRAAELLPGLLALAGAIALPASPPLLSPRAGVASQSAR